MKDLKILGSFHILLNSSVSASTQQGRGWESLLVWPCLGELFIIFSKLLLGIVSLRRLNLIRGFASRCHTFNAYQSAHFLVICLSDRFATLQHALGCRTVSYFAGLTMKGLFCQAIP